MLRGGIITPGGVDGHVHFDKQEPVMMISDDSFETGTRSAVCGGTTTIVTFAAQSQVSLLSSWKDYIARADNSTYCDYATHMIINKPDKHVLEEEFPVLLKEHGVSSVKIFMTYKGLMLRDNEIMDVMIMCRRHGVTVLVHAESGDMINWMVDRLVEKNMILPHYHGWAQPQVVEAEATNRALVMSGLLDTPLLFVHMSAPGAVSVLREASTQGRPVFAETCPQYLFLTEEDMKGTHDTFEGAKCVCSPPVRKNSEDLEVLWNGLRNGTFTILSSDHAAVKYESCAGKKAAFSKFPDGRFSCIPNGIPGVETRMPLLFNFGVGEGRLSIEKFVELLCTNPAKLYGLYPRKGTILPGVSDADLCIWYPDGQLKPFTLENEHLHHNVDYTPYRGKVMHNWPRYTLLRGEVVWEHGTLKGKKGFGEYLKRGVSKLAKPTNQWLSEWRPAAELEVL